MADEILQHASLDELRPYANRNLEELFRGMAGLEGSRLEEGGSVSRHPTFPTNPMFKGAWATRLSDSDVEEAIDDTIGWFRSQGAPFFFWWTGPETEPTDFGARLEQRGFLSMEGQQKALAHGIMQTAAGAPVMALDLAIANEAVMDNAPPDLNIREVERPEQLDDFKRVFVETYQIPEWAGQAWVDATMTMGIGRSPWRIFVGYLGEEPVATNMLFNGGGVASVYAVAALPKAQRRGIGCAITLKPLLEARNAGYRYAVLFSSEEGYRAYQRIGFEDTGARINRYMWRAE